MNIFHRVTLRSLTKNKTRTIVTIIGIILSAAMICAVTTFTSSMQNFALENAIYADGNWHSKTTSANYEKIISSSEVSEYFVSGKLGYAVAEGCKNEFKPYIYIMTAEKNFLDNMPVYLTSGRMPEKKGEIILPEHLNYNGGVKHKIGEALTLDIGKRMLEGEELWQNSPCYTYDENGNEVKLGEVLDTTSVYSFTVVGFYERPSFELITAPGYTAITYLERDEIIGSEEIYDVYFKMKNPAKVYTFMNENNIWGNYNSDVLTYLGSFRYSSFMTVLYNAAIIVISLIMFGSVSLIYNAFAISVSERTRDFGLLSSIGTTKKQLKKMVLFEALAVAAVGIPLGIASGVGGIAVTLMIIGNKFTAISGYPIPMRVCVSPVSIVVAIIVSLITVLISAAIPSKRATRVSAIEAIRQSRDIKVEKFKDKAPSKLTLKLFKIPGMLASKYYRRSRKKYRTTVISLFMSIVLFVSASSFTSYLTMTVNDSKYGNGYDIVFHTDGEDFTDITPDELLAEIKTEETVKDGAYTHFVYIETELPYEMFNSEAKEYLTEGEIEGTLYTSIGITFVNDDQFKALLKKYGQREDIYFNSEKPIALAIDGNTFFDIDSEKYVSAKLLKNNSGTIEANEIKQIDGYYFYGEDYGENGEIYAYLYKSEKYPDDIIELTPSEALKQTSYSYGGVIYERPYFMDNSATISLLYPISAIPNVIQNGQDTDYYNFYFLSKDHAKSYTEIKNIVAENGLNSKNVIDYAETIEENRNIVTIVQVFSYGFIVLISLIAAANVFNTLSTNINLRRREFAVLKSVGMTDRDFNRMMNYECLLYGAKSLLWGVPVSIAISYLIHQPFDAGYVTDYRLPLSAIVIAAFSVFAVVFITMRYSIGKIKKANTIDVLKNENI